MKVKVYDRYRFAIPVKGVISKVSEREDKGEGVEVILSTTNNSNYPVGSKIWVHRNQCKVIIGE